MAMMRAGSALCKSLTKHYMARMDDLRKIPQRSIIAIRGADATSFLQGLVTNGPPSVDGCLSALLTPQGKILFAFTLIKTDDGYLLAVHKDAAEALAKRLKLYRLRARVDIDEALDYGAYMSIGGNDQAPGLSLANGSPVKVILEQTSDFANALPDNDYHRHRIAAGRPEWGSDFDAGEVFPMDVNYDLLGGVDYKKGCFVGQEVASRMKRKGDARKRTLIASFEGVPPAKGAAITAGASTLGTIMSGIDGAALALVRLDRWAAALDDNREILVDERLITLSKPTYMENE